jgi:hypothetical protein
MQELQRRRAELLVQIALQREQVAAFGTKLERPLALADRGWSVVQFMRRQPLLVGVLTALFVVRRRGLTGLARMAWKAWKGYGLFRAVGAKLRAL